MTIDVATVLDLLALLALAFLPLQVAYHIGWMRGFHRARGV